MAGKDRKRSAFQGRSDQRAGSAWDPTAQRPKGKSPRTNVAIVLGFVIFLVVVFSALALAIRWYGSHSTDTTMAGGNASSHVVEVAAGMTASQIGAVLQSQGIIADTADFLDLITQHGTENTLQPGKYTFPEGLKLVEIVDMLEKGNGTARYKVTIPEGWSISQIKSLLDKEGKLSGTQYESLTKQLSQYDLPFLGGTQVTGVATMEGLLFPSTYFLSDGQSPGELIKQQLQAFTSKTSAIPWANATDLKVTPYQIVIIASIIEKECRVAAERPQVARVIYNRLAQGMPLQIDATVRYAVNKWTGALTDADLATKSPYNTYVNKGFPPAPICNPGEATLRAALEPVDGDWVYYVLKDTSGHHFFTSSYEEFLQAKENQPTQ
jgi:UPF0755 protein